MTPQEWMDIAATIQTRWPNIELPVSTLQQWGEDLEDLDGAQIRATIDTIARDGREFAPNSGIIRKRHTELMLDPPDWGEALEQLREIQRAHPEKAIELPEEEWPDDGVGVAIVRPRDEVIASAHPMVVAFREYLESQIAEGVQEDGGNEARLREKWAAFRKTAEKRLSYLGIEPAGLPALERPARRKELREAGAVFSDLKDSVARQRPALEETND